MAIGNFDGVHRGHREVLARAVADARARGLDPLVMTFHPHPSVVLGRGAGPLLTTIGRKVELIVRLGDDVRVIVEPFTRELASMSPRRFVQEVLVESLGAKVVLVGNNFRFGSDRAGDLATLEALGRELGFTAGAEPIVGDAHGPYSSTRIRQALAAGDVAAAESVLGRPHSVSGTVVEGDRRGRTLGFPTANLSEVEEALPPNGVYACVVDRIDEGWTARRLARAVTNIGSRPTVSAGFSVEAHLLDFDDDLYGSRLRVHLLEKLRDEKKFSGLDELRDQIGQDVRNARPIVAARQPDPAAGPAWF